MNSNGTVTLKWTKPHPGNRLAEPIELEVRAREVVSPRPQHGPTTEIDIILDGVPITLEPEQAQFVANALALYGFSAAWEKRR